MTPQQIVAIAVRLMAVWLGVSSIGYLAAIPLALTQHKAPEAIPTSYGIGIVSG